jgi:hypothetical protein
MIKLFFLLSVPMLFMSSCRYVHGRHVSGNGSTGTETRAVNGFTGVETRGAIDLVVRQGDFNVKVEADQNLLQYIETTVENGHLVVGFRNGISIEDINTARVYVSAPELNDLETHGSGNISGEGKISDKNKIVINVSGSGDIELHIDCPAVVTETHGSGNITIDGDSKSLSTTVTGSGDVKLAGLKAETVKASIHGSGNTEVFASESLDVEIFGSGDVHYRGEPKISSSIHGSGEVSKMD